MLDFTSALYLGLRHPSGSLRPWDSLSLGRPALLEEPPRAEAVAAQLAGLQGCERALLVPSTLHLFMDLFELLASEPVVIYLDAGSYPIARWGAERITARGVPLRTIPRHDPDALQLALRRDHGRRPVVVTDGYCPLCGGVAPLPDYLTLIRRYAGILVVDDTQALGILGADPGPEAPYGRGGGGVLRLGRLQGPDILVGSSLAKGFGVPVAALAGSAALIQRYSAEAPTRVHCSPPSVAAIHAAERALAVNRHHGDRLRLRLAERVARFRRGLTRIGLTAEGGLFPVQMLRPVLGLDTVSLHRALWRRGVRTVPLRRRGRGDARLGFLVTVRHSFEDIERCMAVLADVTAGVGSGLARSRHVAPTRNTPEQFSHP